MQHAVLSIAGSDPSGGAGIQADLKAFTSIGVYSCAAITCLTAQNTRGVMAVQPVAPGFVRKQVELVLDDMPVSHIKTGMIGTAGIARALGDVLQNFKGEIICDPVLIASDGRPLMEEHGLEDFLSSIAANATVITPNLSELSAMTGVKIENKTDMDAAVLHIFNRFTRVRLVLVTGGHFEEDSSTVQDFLFERNKPSLTLEHSRYRTNNTHGTGCTFAAAFAAHHLLSNDDHQAFQQTVNFMDSLLKRSADHPMGHGIGPLQHHLCK